MTAKSAPPKAMFPTVDADQLLAAQQRNVDAMTSAGQIVVDGAKTYALRQGEMVQASVDQWMARGKQVFALKPMEFKPAEQVAEVKSAYEAAVANARELAEIAMKAQNDAMSVLTTCAAANLDDIKSLAKVA